MIRKLKSKIVRLTHELAVQIATMPRSFCERALSASHLDRLAIELTPVPLKTFIWSTVIIDGVEYRVNGQHSSYIYAEGLLQVPDYAEVLLEQFVCDSKEEASQVWGRYDSDVENKTRNDVVGAWARTEASLKDVPPSLISRVIAGVSLAAGDRKYKSRDDVGRAVLANRDFTLFVNRMLHADGGKKTNGAAVMLRKMQKSPVIAAMLLTHKRDAVAAEEFWRSVREGLGAGPLSPVTVLREYILTTGVTAQFTGKGGRANSYSSHESSPAIFEKCLRCWNAWREGRELRVLKALGTIPEVV